MTHVNDYDYNLFWEIRFLVVVTGMTFFNVGSHLNIPISVIIGILLSK